MNFPGIVYVSVFVAAALTTALAVPFWRFWSRRWGWVDDPGHRKIHGTPIPLAGGLAVFTGMVSVLLMGVLVVVAKGVPPDSLDRLTYGLERRWPQLVALWVGAVGMLVLGWWDDLHELPAGIKFLGQGICAVLVAAGGVRVTLFVPSQLFSYGVTILWILTVTNALNFNDNMNGLCAGLGILGAGWFAVISALHGQYLVATLAFLVAGALLGFLPYNYPRATVFLGDAGSHWVGYWLAVLAILPHFYSSKHPGSRWAVLSPVCILAVPLLDLASVVWSRTTAGRPFWRGDTNHLSHRLVRGGLPRAGAVAILWLAAAAAGAAALALQ